MKKSAMVSWPIGVLMIVALLLVPNLGCNIFSKGPSHAMDVDLSLSRAPRLGETAELTLVVTSPYCADNVTVKAILPEGFELVSGDLTWRGDIPEGWRDKSRKTAAKGGTVKLEAVIKAVEVGSWAIEGKAGHRLGPRSFQGGIDIVYFLISEDSAKMSDMWIPPRPLSEMRSVDPRPMTEEGKERLEQLRQLRKEQEESSIEEGESRGDFEVVGHFESYVSGNIISFNSFYSTVQALV